MLQCTPHVTHGAMPVSQATFTIRLDQELKDSFTSAAKSMDRTGAQLLRDYIRDVVRLQKEAEEHGASFREQVQIGLDSANAGNLVSNRDVQTMFATRRAETRRKLDEPS